MMGTLFDNHKVVGFAELLPDFHKLRGQQSPKKRTDTNIREVIAVPPNRAPARRIVSVFGMIERLFHKPGKRSRSAVFDFCADNVDQSRVARFKNQRSTFNV
jgi:hypothetical protein